MRVERISDLGAPELGELFMCLWLELDEIYGPNPGTEFVPSDMAKPGCAVFVVYDGDRALGCAALQPWIQPSALEVKRMYVRPEARGTAAARSLLEAMELAAREREVAELRLETGVHQPRAIAFYLRNGFESCDCWGQYYDDPTSCCMVKPLT